MFILGWDNTNVSILGKGQDLDLYSSCDCVRFPASTIKRLVFPKTWSLAVRKKRSEATKEIIKKKVKRKIPRIQFCCVADLVS